MEKQDKEPGQVPKESAVIYYAVQLLALGLLLVWCFFILEPFITPLVWAAVLATALYPLHEKLSSLVKKQALSATIITVLLILLIIGPGVALLFVTVDEFKELMTAYKTNDLHVPPPPEKVADWPIIGKEFYGLWSSASENLSETVIKHQEEIKPILFKFLNLLKSSASGLLLFTFSIVISGIMLSFAKEEGEFAKNFFVRIVGKQGEKMAENAEKTVRNVAKGILGVALIQSIFAGIGLVMAGIPFAGIWILICLILAIVQIGILPVSLGSIIYIWGTAETGTALLFTIWMILVGLMDNFLKPIMLGKGAPAPMAVVFIGAIGGFIFSGFIGLFTGAIILSLGYNLAMGWIYNKTP
ncbi:AI-2E family transporter [Shivajiella indica]|uniref:AI-2E family transporter n=1 Tax=Shivajiella indica TaxID=872115 RepID=A0ABW5BCD3_9BACT